jgi:hypothetical protein
MTTNIFTTSRQSVKVPEHTNTLYSAAETWQKLQYAGSGIKFTKSIEMSLWKILDPGRVSTAEH